MNRKILSRVSSKPVDAISINASSAARHTQETSQLKGPHESELPQPPWFTTNTMGKNSTLGSQVTPNPIIVPLSTLLYTQRGACLLNPLSHLFRKGQKMPCPTQSSDPRNNQMGKLYIVLKAAKKK